MRRGAVRDTKIAVCQPAERFEQQPLGHENAGRIDVLPIAVAGKIGANEILVPLRHWGNQLGRIADGTGYEFRSALGQGCEEEGALRRARRRGRGLKCQMLCMRDSQQLKLALELVAFAERDIQLAPQFIALAERDIQLAPQLVAFTERLAQLAPDFVALSLGLVSLAQIFVTLAQSDVSAGLDQALELPGF